MSARFRLYVVQGTLLSGGAWVVKLQSPTDAHGQQIASYGKQSDAIAHAVGVARQLCVQGRLAQVHVSGIDGRFRTEWTYGNDPPEYPG
jgi:hypothetical protein